MSVQGTAMARARANEPARMGPEPGLTLSADLSEYLRAWSFATAFSGTEHRVEIGGVLGAAGRTGSVIEADWCELIACEHRAERGYPFSPAKVKALREQARSQTTENRTITAFFRTCLSEPFTFSPTDVLMLRNVLPECSYLLLAKPQEDGAVMVRVFHSEASGPWTPAREFAITAATVPAFSEGSGAVTSVYTARRLAAAMEKAPPRSHKLLAACAVVGVLAGLGTSIFELRMRMPMLAGAVASVEASVAGLGTAPAKPEHAVAAVTENAPTVLKPSANEPGVAGGVLESAPAREAVPVAPEKVVEAPAEPRGNEAAPVEASKIEVSKIEALKTEPQPEASKMEAIKVESEKKAQLEIPVMPLTPPRAPEPRAPEPRASEARVPEIRRLEPAPVLELPQPLERVSPITSPFGESLVYGATQMEVHVAIDARGRVSEARLARPVSKPNELLAKQALAAARQWTFVPAKRGGQPVEGEFTIQFRFR